MTIHGDLSFSVFGANPVSSEPFTSASALGCAESFELIVTVWSRATFRGPSTARIEW